jgi:hypothetical protein
VPARTGRRANELLERVELTATRAARDARFVQLADSFETVEVNLAVLRVRIPQLPMVPPVARNSALFCRGRPPRAASCTRRPRLPPRGTERDLVRRRLAQGCDRVAFVLDVDLRAFLERCHSSCAR